MLACKGIFAKPTMARVRKRRTAAIAARLRKQDLCAHYTMKQKCLLAKAFLRSRQWRGCAKAHSGDSRKTAIARLLRTLYHNLSYSSIDRIHNYFCAICKKTVSKAKKNRKNADFIHMYRQKGLPRQSFLHFIGFIFSLLSCRLLRHRRG